MPYLNTTDGTALFFRDWGTGDPVVFVHGWGLNSDMWEYQLPIDECRLVVYENASHWPFVTHRERLNDDLAAYAGANRVPVAMEANDRI
jgi:pimeloyl-ACP methyl ester carboxylesterase